MSWSHDHFDHNNVAFNFDYNNLVGEDKASFELLREWGTRLKSGLRKLKCEEIIKAKAESKDSLKALLTGLKAYDPEIDTNVLKRREEAAANAALKAGSKRKRREAAQGGVASSSTRPPKFLKTSEILEKFGIKVPLALDFVAVLRVREAAIEMARQIEEEPDF